MHLTYVSTCLLILNFSGLNLAHTFGFRRRHTNLDDLIIRDDHEYGKLYAGEVKNEPSFKLFTQKLNHFSPGKETWQQRYLAEPTFYGNNGIVFLYVTGEWTLRAETVTKGNTVDLAKKYKAFLFGLEHRFYGESKPLPDASVASLKYLNVDQAIEDTAYFITEMNKEHKFKNPKWIIFGGSYAGTLAHWARYKHPKLVYAAVASSAPLLAKLNFHEYLEHVSTVLTAYNPKCTEILRIVNEKLIENSYNSTGRKNYEKLFKLCDPFVDNEKDIENFLAYPIYIMSGAVQYDCKEKNAYTDVFSVRGACAVLTDESIKDPILRLVKLSNLELVQDEVTCYDFVYKKVIEKFKKTSYSDKFVASGARQWLWQTCNEYGWYQTSEKKGSTFGDKILLKFNTDMCVDVFGPKYNAAFNAKCVKRTNKKYHALSIPVTRVLSVHGSVDPWSRMGITKNPPAGTSVIVIEGASHCADMYAESPYDVPDLKRGRAEISKIVGDWLKAG